MDFPEQDYLELCKTKIEEKYHSGIGDGRMRQRDFEYLIDLIEEKSGIKLSVSTLKRLWRENSGQNPHPSTLNALVSILGYKDWLDFKLQHRNAPDIKSAGKETPPTHSVRSKKPMMITVAVLILISFLVLAVVEFDVFKTNKSVEKGDVEVLFTANKTVAVGVPNTVIFNYDFKGVQADSFFIQQDWNPNNKEPVDPGGEYFSSVYYLPGFHKAKLIAGETILKIEKVHIQTDGWISAALYSFEEPPVYLPFDTTSEDILTVHERSFPDHHVNPERFGGLLFQNIREFGDLDGHNFKFDTRFKYREFFNDPCPSMQFTIHTEVHIYFVPLTLKGCVSNLGIKIGEVYVSGRDHDFSGFGTDIYEWQNLSLHVKDKTGTVYLNGEPVFETAFEQDFGRIVGLDYRFSGLGEVDYVKLSDLANNPVYEENFRRIDQDNEL